MPNGNLSGLGAVRRREFAMASGEISAACANSFSRSGDEGNLLASHPSVKPIAMIADPIMDATARRDIVLFGVGS